MEVEGSDGSRTVLWVHGGFLQVIRNQVTLLTDRAQISQGTKEDGVQLATTLAAQDATES